MTSAPLSVLKAMMVLSDALNGYGLFQAKVAPGTHTIQLINTGNTTSSISGGTAIQIDMFVAFQ
jgi:hypothetical protein